MTEKRDKNVVAAESCYSVITCRCQLQPHVECIHSSSRAALIDHARGRCRRRAESTPPAPRRIVKRHRYHTPVTCTRAVGSETIRQKPNARLITLIRPGLLHTPCQPSRVVVYEPPGRISHAPVVVDPVRFHHSQHTPTRPFLRRRKMYFLSTHPSSDNRQTNVRVNNDA